MWINKSKEKTLLRRCWPAFSAVAVSAVVVVANHFRSDRDEIFLNAARASKVEKKPVKMIQAEDVKALVHDALKDPKIYPTLNSEMYPYLDFFVRAIPEAEKDECVDEILAQASWSAMIDNYLSQYPMPLDNAHNLLGFQGGAIRQFMPDPDDPPEKQKQFRLRSVDEDLRDYIFSVQDSMHQRKAMTDVEDILRWMSYRQSALNHEKPREDPYRNAAEAILKKHKIKPTREFIDAISIEIVFLGQEMPPKPAPSPLENLAKPSP